MVKDYVKTFPTTLFKEIIIKKNDKTNLFDIRVAFHKSNAITLFEGSAKCYQINHLCKVPSMPMVIFHAEIDPEKTKILIKGKFQVRTFVKRDKIQKFVFEQYGSRYDPKKVISLKV